MEVTVKIYKNIHFASCRVDGAEVASNSSWARYEYKKDKVLFFNEVGDGQGYFKNVVRIEVYSQGEE